MVYIPKNRCTLNLIAANDEWVFKSDKSKFYNGDYWKLYTGAAYTGKGPNDEPNYQEIVPSGPETEPPAPFPIPESNYIPLHMGAPDPIIDRDFWSQAELRNYLSLTNQRDDDEQLRKIPFTYYPQPTHKDYKLGIFERYFLVRVNFDEWIEVDKSTYKAIHARDSNNWTAELYVPIKFMWTLVGPKDKVHKVNKEMVSLYEKKAGYVRSRKINFPRLGLKKYLNNNFIKFKMGNTPQEVESIFLVKKLNKLDFNQTLDVVEKAEYIVSGKEPELLNDTKIKANEQNRSVFEQALFEANWELYKEPTIVTPEESKAKTIWRVSKEMKLKQDRKEEIIKKADYIMLDTTSDWYKATEEKANEADVPIYEQAMKEAEYVLYSGNPKHKAKVKEKKEINEIVKDLRLIGERKEWVKNKALYIKSGDDKNWLEKTKEKRKKWNRNNPEDQRTLLYQCFKEALFLWNKKHNIPQ